MLVARSVAEAHLYLDLRGAPRVGRTSSLEMRGDELVSVYEADLPDGRARLEFSIPKPEADSGGYGDDEPSTLISAEEFLAWSERVGSSVAIDPADIPRADRAEARRRLLVAARCLDEAGKFPGVDRHRIAARADAYRALAYQLTG
jgi:hypothetical protein